MSAVLVAAVRVGMTIVNRQLQALRIYFQNPHRKSQKFLPLSFCVGGSRKLAQKRNTETLCKLRLLTVGHEYDEANILLLHLQSIIAQATPPYSWTLMRSEYTASALATELGNG